MRSTTVTGTPTYTIDVGGGSKTASYVSGSGTSSLKFSYTIATGDTDTAGGITSGTGALVLAGGTLKDGAGNAAALTTAVAASNTLAVDTVAPDAVDLNPAGAINATSAVTVNKANIAAGVAFDADIATPSAGDIAKITVTLGNIQTGDNLLLDADRALSSSFNETTSVTLGIANVNYTYASNVLTVTKHGGGSFSAAEVESIVEAIKLKNTNSAPGDVDRTAAFAYVDAAGNTGTSAVATMTVVATAPTVSSTTISATDSSNTAKTSTLVAGDKVVVTVAMSEATTVTGTPTYTIDVGGVSKTASYVSGSGTSSLKFSYTIATGDTDTAGGITSGTGALVLAGGTLKDGAGNAAALTTAVAASNTLAVDTTAPTVSSTTISATDSSNTAKTSTLVAGDKVVVTVAMSEATTVTGTPTYTIDVGGGVSKTASYVSGSGTSSLKFSYTIATGDTDTAGGITSGTGALVLAGGTLKDGAGNAAALTTAVAASNTLAVDTTAPTVSSTTISATDSSNTAKTSTLVAGDKVVVTVAMSEATTVTGTPTYTIDVGGVSKTASYVSGSGTSSLKFSYTIATGDTDTAGGITSGTGALVLAGGTLKDGAGNAAALTTAVAASNTLAVDTVAPDAVDLNPAGAINATSAVTVNKANIAAGVAFDADIATPSAGDIAKITVTLGNIQTGDNLLLDADRALSSSFNETTSVTLGIANVNYTYASNVLTVTKHGGGSFSAAEVESIVEAIKLKNTNSAPGDVDRTAAFAYVDAAGNTGTSAVATMTVVATAPTITSVTDNHSVINISGIDAEVNGVYTLVADPSSLTLSADFNPTAGNGVIDSNKPVYSYLNSATGETWYLWAREDSGYHISRLDSTTKWFWESASPANFETDPTAVASWMQVSGNAGAFTSEPTLVTTASLEDSASSGTVIYTVTFSHGVVSSFTSNDVVLVDASGGEVIDTANWTISAPTEVSGSLGKSWTVSVTPPSGINAIDVTAVRLQLNAGAVEDANGNLLAAQFTQTPSSQSFDTQPPSVPTLTLNTDTGTSAADGITNNGMIDVTDLAIDLASWQYSVNGGVSWTTVSDSAVTSFTLEPGTYGANLIRVRQTDNAGQTSNITKYITDITVDTIIDTPTLSPADGGAMSNADNFVLTFAESMTAVTGKNIVIKRFSDDFIVETIAADNGTQVSINATGVVMIDPTDINLIARTSYYIEVEVGAFKDTVGNESAAITGNTAWNITVNEMNATIAVATDNKVNAIENATDITIAVTIGSTPAILGDLSVGDFSVTVTKVSDSSNVAFTSAIYNNGIWTAIITGGGLTNGDSYTIQANVTGSVGSADTLTTSSTQTVTVNTDAPTLTLADNNAIVGSDNVVNIVESASGFSITGASTGLAIGSEVSVVFNAIAYTTIVTDASGNWNVSIPSTDTSVLIEGTIYAVTVDASDDHGNPATPQLSQDITVDKSAPVSTVVIDEVITDLPTITGQTSANISVEIKLDTDNDSSYDDATYTVTSDASGNWTLDLNSTTSLTSGSAPTFASIDTQLGVQVNITDAAGNMTSRTETATKQDSSYSISDSRVIEGTLGTKTMAFMVTRGGDLSDVGTVDYAVDTTLSLAKSGGTADGIDDDYSGSTSGTATFAAGESFKEITFTVNGDYYKEVNQNIIVDLTNPTEGAISKATGIGEISEVDVSVMSGAFSLKDINADLVSNAIRVRRSSDDAELDIGFDKYGNLDTQVLLDFVGTGIGDTGYVTTWYDQSARGESLTQTINGKQGVIVNNGQLVTTSDGLTTISFNQGLNGNDDTMSMTGTGGTATNLEIYVTYQYQSAAQGVLFSLGSDGGNNRIGAHAPWRDKETYWDVEDGATHVRLKTKNAQTANQVQQLVFIANFNHSGTGTTAQNKVDAEQAFFIDGVVKGAGTLGSTDTDVGSTWYIMATTGGNSGYQAGMMSEFLVYTDNSNTVISDPGAFVGSAVNNTFTYAGEGGLTSVDGKGGYDTVYLSGTSTNLDTTVVILKSIELIHMQNGETNILTINDAQLTANSFILSVLMDTGDSIIYEGATLAYDANAQELIVFGSTGNDTINMSSFNETVYGRGGNDTFVYKSWSDAAASSSADTIADFIIAAGTNKDILDLKDLLSGYSAGSFTDFIELNEVGGNTVTSVDANGAIDNSGVFTADLSITLTGVTGANLATMISDGNLVLE
ncbi:beta strand repeat-containing protein [Isorropodon fossajaponicum symbiont]|uniref:beta strand repeat-containing protein n=1 Tax=Isorropodon fossajaponicum symbiont TaxID=883811 RepID=UPI0019156252|nr:type I secretion C-terminal target domain-containing protein [Isorropodon fossajaponicum symbiont]